MGLVSVDAQSKDAEKMEERNIGINQLAKADLKNSQEVVFVVSSNNSFFLKKKSYTAFDMHMLFILYEYV